MDTLDYNYELYTINNELFENTMDYPFYNEMLSNSWLMLAFVLAVSFSLVFVNLVALVSIVRTIKSGNCATSIYLLFGNLLAAECIYGVLTFIITNNNGHGFPGFFMYLIYGLMNIFGLASHLIIGLIAINRCLYILHDRQYRKWMTTTFQIVILVVAWFIGVMATVLIYFSNYFYTDSVFITEISKYVDLVLNLFFMIPVVCVCVTWGFMFSRVGKKVNQAENSNLYANEVMQNMNGLTNNQLEGDEEMHPNAAEQRKGFLNKCFVCVGNERIIFEKRKSLIMITVLVLNFAIYCIPSATIYVARAVTECGQRYDKCKFYDWISSILYVVSIATRLLHPFIYAWWHRRKWSTRQPINLS